MKFEQLAKRRHSVRRFKRNPVEAKKVQSILEAARIAPSAKNNQSWKVLVLQTPEALEKLKQCTVCHYNAPLAFVVSYDEEEVFRQADGTLDSGVTDASIAATHMMLQACELGVGSTWVMNFNASSLREAYQIPEHYIPTAILVCGYPSEDAGIDRRHELKKSLEEQCSYNEYETTKEEENVK